MLGFIISPAKKMNVLEGPPYPSSRPAFIEDTKQLMEAVKALDYGRAQELWKCSDKLAELNYARFYEMDLDRDLTAAVIAYEGIQFQHLAPQVMDESALTYLGAHLRILSGFYGVLHPFDGIVPYRLEMQAKLAVGTACDLYEFWADRLAQALSNEFDTLINLASVEYAKAVVPYAAQHSMRVVTCLFGAMSQGHFVQRSTEAKATRGTFMRWCAENTISTPEDFSLFNERGYMFDTINSTDDTYVFVKQSE